MSQYRLTLPAENDLTNIWLYIAQDNPVAADRVLDFLDNQCKRLSQSPELGRLRPDFAAHMRVFIASQSAWRSRYLICYRIKDERIEVIRILEGHQNIDEGFFDE